MNFSPLVYVLLAQCFILFSVASPFPAQHVSKREESATTTGWNSNKNPYPKVRRDTTSFTFQSAKKGKVTIQDPYNWLEKLNENEVKSFVSSQTSFTNSFLSSNCANFKEDKESIQKAANFPTVTVPKSQGPTNDLTYVYKVNFPEKQRPIWYLAKRKDIDASQKDNYVTLPGSKFFDENLISNDGSKSIVDIQLSPDGKVAAYTYDGGDGKLEIFFRKTSSPFLNGNSISDDRTRLPDHIINQNGFFWLNDSSSIIYSQSGDKAQVRIHHLGRDQNADEVLLDSDPSDPSIGYMISKTQDSAWIMVFHGQGKDGGLPIYLASLTQPLKSPLKWLSITMGNNGYWGYYTNIGNDFYFSTNGDDAKNYKIIRIQVDPTKSRTVKSLTELKDEAKPEDVIPEHSGILQSGVVFGDGKLLAYYLEDAKHNMYSYDLRSGKELQKLQNTGLFIQDLDATALGSEAYFLSSTFNKPYVINRYTFDANQQIKTETIVDRKVSGVDLESFIVEEHHAPSKDGAQVPFTIMYKKGAKFDGSLPALLYFFGFLRVDWYPYYNQYFVSWIQNYGGILVNINARGGSDKGLQWATDGQQGNHQHTFDDILAVANYLIENKIAQKGKLALYAGGLGGTGAMVVANQAQEGLLGTVIADRSPFDLLRFEKINPDDVSLYYDLGNPNVPEQFDWLYPYSPLHNINGNKTYPLLFISAADRPNSASYPQHSYKMISELQYSLANKPNPSLLYNIKNAAQSNEFSEKGEITALEAYKQCVIAYGMGLKRISV